MIDRLELYTLFFKSPILERDFLDSLKHPDVFRGKGGWSQHNINYLGLYLLVCTFLENLGRF